MPFDVRKGSYFPTPNSRPIQYDTVKCCTAEGTRAAAACKGEFLVQ